MLFMLVHIRAGNHVNEVGHLRTHYRLREKDGGLRPDSCIKGTSPLLNIWTLLMPLPSLGLSSVRSSKIHGDLSAAEGGAASFFMLSNAILSELSMR